MPVKYIDGAGRKGDYNYTFGGGANEVFVSDTDTSHGYTLYGGGGLDRLTGGFGADRLYGEKGNDRLDGRDGNDFLYGELGDDYLYGGAGDDLLDGGVGSDVLEGGWGDDQLIGGAGNDFLYGGEGRDVLNGDDGDDWLYGMGGADELTGGAGADKFMFAIATLNGGSDVIKDYSRASGDEIWVNSGQLNLTAARFVSTGDFIPGYSSGSDQFYTVIVGTTTQRGTFVADHSASTGITTAYLAHYFYDTDENTLYYDSDNDGSFSDIGGADAVFTFQNASMTLGNIATNLAMLIG